MAAATGTAVPTLEMNNGIAHPAVGYGTYKVGVIPASASSTTTTSPVPDAKQVIGDALAVGYRYFDCAEFYGNEAEVGAAFASSGVKREELFLVSKCWTDTIYGGPDKVKAQVEKCLKDLQTEYLDMYLVHWPVPGKHVAAYLALEELQKAGKIRSLGLSNYTVEDYLELEGQMTIKPCVNQIEINPFLNRKNTIEFFKSRGILMEAYRALRNGTAMDDEVVTAIAKKHGKSPAQILGRWSLQQGLCFVAKSARKERMIENLAILDFVLDADDLASLDKLTTEENIEKFKALYEKCVVRDTPLADSREGVKTKYTVD